MKPNCVVIHEKDNVAVVTEEIKSRGRVLALDLDLDARTDIPRNHKVAIAEIPKGSAVVKYGETIGIANEDIKPGEWVHTHNMEPEGEK